MKNKIINGLSALVIAVSLSSTAGAADLVIQSDSEFMFGIKPLLKKKLNTNKGKTIRFNDVYVWSYNDDRWMNGGPLELINDDSMGTQTRVTCAISASAGDVFMENPKRQSVSMTGTLVGYTDYGGTMIEPCEIGAPIK
ncbi:MAG: Uncharacterised protein [Rhodospirillaceae bacterium]|nr:MAG: Uncharacterised protein [Rhodospirillaceae bacterium]